MQTIAIITPKIAALGQTKVDLIIRTLAAFHEYYAREEPNVTDFESEWPSEYGALRFVLSKKNNSAVPNRTILVSFSNEEVPSYWALT